MAAMPEDEERPGVKQQVELALMVMYEIRRHALDANVEGRLAVYGLDSLDMVAFAMYLGNRLKIRIPQDGAFEKLETIDEVVRYVEALRAACAESVADPMEGMSPSARLAQALREDGEMRSGRDGR